jgi:hypothetical protein
MDFLAWLLALKHTESRKFSSGVALLFNRMKVLREDNSVQLVLHMTTQLSTDKFKRFHQPCCSQTCHLYRHDISRPSGLCASPCDRSPQRCSLGDHMLRLLRRRVGRHSLRCNSIHQLMLQSARHMSLQRTLPRRYSQQPSFHPRLYLPRLDLALPELLQR